MKITKKSIILLAFSVILMVLGLWNYADANPVTYQKNQLFYLLFQLS